MRLGQRVVQVENSHIILTGAGALNKVRSLLSCQPRMTVMSCFVYKVIRDTESIDHLCINPIRRIGLIRE